MLFFECTEDECLARAMGRDQGRYEPGLSVQTHWPIIFEAIDDVITTRILLLDKLSSSEQMTMLRALRRESTPTWRAPWL